MKYYTIDRNGKVFCGKANSWKDVSIQYGEKLYNPYTKRTVIGWRNYCTDMEKSQKEFYAKTEYPKGVKVFGGKGKPIGVIPYDLGKAKCEYADELKRQDIARGKSVRPDKYYHDKAWKALDIDGELKRRGLR